MFFCRVNLGEQNSSWSFKAFSSFSPLEAELCLAGRGPPLVGRLVCLSMFVSGDRQWGDKAVAIIVTRCHSFLLVSALWPHTIALLFRFCTLLKTVIIEIHVFALLRGSSTFQNITYLVTCLSKCWLHVFKCIRLRHTRDKIFFSCRILYNRENKRITLNQPILQALWFF